MFGVSITMRRIRVEEDRGGRNEIGAGRNSVRRLSNKKENQPRIPESTELNLMHRRQFIRRSHRFHLYSLPFSTHTSDRPRSQTTDVLDLSPSCSGRNY
ncbi:hypothetical protein L2E82_27010 [Cichorium intybus]|uniref:Uncharacterized protein n=1 Tax=Cichorium intybus TaxID=13427 RepID=A0ACB9CRS8_CICIN|nr:hypothetical protein L2E82_27010 [Cichorium intybus]